MGATKQAMVAASNDTHGVIVMMRESWYLFSRMKGVDAVCAAVGKQACKRWSHKRENVSSVAQRLMLATPTRMGTRLAKRVCLFLADGRAKGSL